MDGVENGFHITNSDTSKAGAYYPNHKTEHKQAVEAQIQEELENGRYKIVNQWPTVISALGALIKQDSGRVRMRQDHMAVP